MSTLDPTPVAIAQRAADLVDVLLTDHEPDRAAVIDVLRAHGEPEPITLRRRDALALQQAALRLVEIFETADVAVAARLLNSILADYGRAPRLTAHQGTPWHLHVDADDDGPWDEWFATSSAMGIATLLAERQAVPVGRCASPSCRRPFVDSGRGSARRYCSQRCATRERVAHYRRGD